MDEKRSFSGEQQVISRGEYDFYRLCEREIVKIRELTLYDDEYTGGLLGDAVSSPVGVTLCVDARMKQIVDLKAEIELLKTQVKKLKRTNALDEGFIDYLTSKSNGDL